MSFLGEPFLHDVFFSYPHADADRVGNSEIKEWSQCFANDIRSYLLRYPKFANISFYLDESGRPGEHLTETQGITGSLWESASKSALLLAMMSPWYLNSEWCKKEREWWQEGTAPNTTQLLGEFGRVFVTKIMETNPEDWPDAFKDRAGVPLKGFLLYDESLPPFEQNPHGMLGDAKDKANYQKARTKLTAKIASTLEEIQKCLERERKRQADLRLLEEEGQILYLHGRPECSDQFNRVGNELRSAGYAVAPEEPSPLSGVGLMNDNQKEFLASSDAVMIVGGDDQKLGQDIIVVGRNRRRLAQALLDKRLPCAVFDILGQDQHPRGRIENARNLDIAWIDSTSSDWRHDIRNWLHASANQGG